MKCIVIPLDAIGEYELDERKVQYEGTLDQLYNNDFEKFLDYNRQDTMLLNKLDEKLKFMALSSELAHANTVLLQTTMGAVAVTEQAIINEAHERGLVVPSPRVEKNLETHRRQVLMWHILKKDCMIGLVVLILTVRILVLLEH